MAGRAPLLSEAIARYIGAHGVREPQVLRELRAATQSVPHAGMQIGADQGAFLAMLVKLMGARRCLEIGTYTGYSALAVALALPEDGRIVCCDVSDEYTRVGRPFWKKAGVERKIDLRLAPALETLQRLEGPFDFAFIDADKENYVRYYERCLELLRPGGVIAADNVLWSGEVANAEAKDALTLALRAFNEHVHRDARVELVMLSIGDGVTLLRKR
ncbi:MAG TPA: class I SAM-dependent methyltransferase [Burkholderiales bacterium]|nr:class I SAM-dependent methyltransferase [Burkholderiales bacterium]